MYSPGGADGGSGIPEEEKAEKLLQDGSYERAAELFLKASNDNPDHRGRLLHRTAVAYWRAGVYDRAADVFKAAMDEYRRIGDQVSEARNILGLGASYHGLNRMSEAYRVVHDALEIAERTKDLKTVTEATSWLGIICKDQGDYTLALEHHRNALELSRQLGSRQDLSAAMNSIGLTYYHMGDYDEAMRHFRQALEIQRAVEDSWGLPDTLNSIGMTLRKMNRPEEALEFYKEALEARKKAGGKARTANILNNMGNLYASMRDTDKAVKCHTEALAIRKAIKSRSGTADSLLNLGEAYKEAGKLHKAAVSLEESLSHQQNNIPDEVMLNTMRMLAQVREMMGDGEGAYRLSEKALDLSVDLYRDQVQKRLVESREILETEHRVREAKLLVTRNRKLQDLSGMLASQKEQLQLILDFVPAVIIFIDNEGTVIRLNRYAALLCGREPRQAVGRTGSDLFGSLGRTMTEVCGQDWQESVEPVLDSEESVTFDGDERDFLCHRIPYRETAGEVSGTVVFAIDITDEKKAEQRRKEIQELTSKTKRLESLGYLAGSIAHDFNNLLLGIMGNVELVQGRTNDARSRGNLEKASDSARRAAGLCSQLLAFSGGGNFVFKRLDLSSEVSFILRSMSFDPDVGLQFEVDLSDDLPEIELSPSQLRLTLRNLLGVINDRTGGNEKLLIATGRIKADRQYLQGAVHDTHAGEGEYLFLEVGSTSRKLSMEEFSGMFDPFTSSDVLKTDLRMPAVHGILKSLGGFMTCAEVSDAGCAVRVHLPLVCQGEGTDTRTESGSHRERSGNTILIVDDETSVRETAEEMLSSMNFDVVTCASGPMALQILRERAEEIDCVLLDITMPDMSGHEVIREIAGLQIQTDVILTSGFSERMIIESRDNPCYRGFLKKPYSMDELRDAVEKAMS
ncbi:MAG: tetratricopeptide repeat protein [Candidatus Fermentibacteraceae bacterium]|nr:tetratricopeptide repeat protein [Candidatus Fermentibacteraceae bacterium]